MEEFKTVIGTVERECFYNPHRNLASVREEIACDDLHTAIGLFSIVYDTFGPKFETFVRDDEVRRSRGDPLRPEAEHEMAEWCQVLAMAAEYYARALRARNF